MAKDPQRTGSARDPWIDRLSEYLDGELAGRDREGLEEHLRSCASCSQVLAQLGEVAARAKTLVDVPPAEDLWPRIAERIAEAERPAADDASPVHVSVSRVPARSDRSRQAWWARRFDVSMPQLAAAGVLLMALSAGAVWMGLRSPTPAFVPAPAVRPIARNDAAPPPAPAVSEAGAPAVDDREVGAASALVMVSNPRYDAAVAELEQALAEGRGRLDPRTLRVVEENLRIIDRALDEARRAVAADPGNLWLRSHLAATMKRKVDLLRSATLVASAQG